MPKPIKSTHCIKRIEIVLTYSLSMLFIVLGGITKLMGAQFQRDTFQHYGYPLWWMYVVGAIELMLGIFLLLGRYRFLAAIGMVLITIGVLVSSVRIGEFGAGMLMSPPTIVMICAASLAYMCRDKMQSID